jgi:hypothetical protein
MLGETVVPKAAEAQGANYAIKASQDAKGNVIDTYYATKASVTNITNGTTTVAKATAATKDAKGHTIDTYYATKEELSGVSGGASEAYATKTALKEVDDRVSDIELGVTTVPNAAEATTAGYALRAQKDQNSNVIHTTYATKTELSAKANSSDVYTKTASDNKYATKTTVSALDERIADIELGDTIVPKATEAAQAGYALRATSDGNNKNIAETYATKVDLVEVDNLVADIMFGKTVVPSADEANSANYAIRANKDYNSNVIHETYATKAELADVKDIADGVFDGTYTVPKAAEANTAGYALKATSDGNGNNIVNTYATKTALNNKQDKISSTNKLAASNISGLATVATSGKYSDLSGRLVIGTTSTTAAAGDHIHEQYGGAIGELETAIEDVHVRIDKLTADDIYLNEDFTLAG